MQETLLCCSARFVPAGYGALVLKVFAKKKSSLGEG